MRMSRSNAVLFGLCLVVGVGAGGALPLASAAEREFKIGLLAPLTGGNADIGRSVAAAATAALPEVNDYLAAYDARAALIEKDTEGDPETALAGLIALEAAGVRIVVGPALSSTAQRCVKYADKHGMTLISPSSTSMALSKNDSLFRMLPPDDAQGAVLAEYVASVGVWEVICVHIGDSYGKGLARSFAKAYGERSGVVRKHVAFNEEELSEPDLVLELTEAASAFSDAGKAGVLFIGYGDLTPFFEGVAEEELLTSVRWFASESLLAAAPGFLENETLSGFAEKTNMTTVTIQPDDLITDLYGLHVRSQAAATLPSGETLNQYAFPTWDALWIAAEALRRDALGEAVDLRQAVVDLGAGDAFYGMRRLCWDRDGDQGNGFFYLIQAVAGAWESEAVCEINSSWAKPRLREVDASIAWPPAETASTLTLHGLFPLSGELVLTDAKLGFELAVERVNEFLAAEKIATTITAVCHDTRTDPDEALAIAEDLRLNDGVPVVVGPCASSEVDNVAASVPDLCVVSPTSTALDLAKSDDRVARLSPTDVAQADALAELIEMDGVDEVAILYRDDIWGRGIQSAFVRSFDGGTKLFAYGVDTDDFSETLEEMEDYALNVLAAKKAVLLVSFEEAATIFSQLDAQSPLLELSWYGTDGIANSDALLEEDIGAKAARTGLRCSTYSPYIVDMLSPRLLLFNQWMSGTMAQAADPDAALAYDSTWLAALAYLSNSATANSDPAAIWASLVAQADSLTGYSYNDALDANGDRLSNYYSFYGLDQVDGQFVWNVASSYMESEDESGSLKRVGTLADNGVSSLFIRYRRSNVCRNGVAVAGRQRDVVKAENLPLGEFRLPETLILDNGVMTGSLTVYIDGDGFPCAVNLGDWEKSEKFDGYVFTTSKSKMGESYHPMTLTIDQRAETWSFRASNALLEKLDWSDGVELRIDLDREAVVTVSRKPELRLKLSFNDAKNETDYVNLAMKESASRLGVAKLSACYSSQAPWKGRLVIAKSAFHPTSDFNPMATGVTIMVNDNAWTVPTGADWGGETESGVYRHTATNRPSRIRWWFDAAIGEWSFNAQCVNLVGMANTLVKRGGVCVDLTCGNTVESALVKPKIDAVLTAKPTLKGHRGVETPDRGSTFPPGLSQGGED